MNPLTRPSLLPVLLLLSACGPAAEPPASGPGAAPSPGENTYRQVCAACHRMGVAGAPKVGDADQWRPRIAQGMDTLYRHALEGFTGQQGVMPPRGGRPELSDAAVRAAVDYMVAQSPAP